MDYVGNAGAATQTANIMQMYQTDTMNAQQIYMQMAAEMRKAQMRMWQIQMDLQTKIFETMQEVTLNEAKTADKEFTKWDSFIQQ
jgi:hypothetical protein